jgi:hypothetical protein
MRYGVMVQLRRGVLLLPAFGLRLVSLHTLPCSSSSSAHLRAGVVDYGDKLIVIYRQDTRSEMSRDYECLQLWRFRVPAATAAI